MGSLAQSMEISDERMQLIESGAAAWLATRDSGLRPEAVRVMGTRVGTSRRALTLYLAIAQLGRTLDNLRHNGQAAVFFCRMTDYRALQVKGELVIMRESDASDRDYQSRYREAFADMSARVGIPRQLVTQFAYWPSVAVEISVRELYDQTPGPAAGAPCR